jgi:ABC-2 type transport system permease protein
MPAALRTFAENQPMTHAINAIRAWLVGTPLGDSAWLSIGWSIALIVISVPITTWLFKRHSVQ